MNSNYDEWKALADKWDTDKAAYSWFYPNAFKAYRHRPIKILEIGVHCGSSLLLLDEYFDDAIVYGLDIGDTWKKERWKTKLLNNKRINIHRGHQSDIETLFNLHKDHGPFDIIIDDGSHLVHDIIGTFEFFKDKFNDLYVIEDTVLTMYGRHYEIADTENLGFLKKLSLDNNHTLLQNRNLYKEYWADKINTLDSGRSPFRKISFYCNLICIEK
tara:strand:- start:458 stop:1102 length:645 start_codon:yes stop_codon:yes gene_type:complete